MRLTAAGWSRNHGATEIADINLKKVDTAEGQFTFSRSKPVLAIERNPHPSANGRVESVSLNCFATLRLGGDYQVKVTIEKEEIARLFYLTHKDEVNGLVDALPILRRV